MPIPLNGAATYTFTQRVGEVPVLAAEATLQPSATSNFCGATLTVRGTGSTGPIVGMFMTGHTNKGEYGELIAPEVIPAPASDRQVSIEAVVVEGHRTTRLSSSCTDAETPATDSVP